MLLADDQVTPIHYVFATSVNVSDDRIANKLQRVNCNGNKAFIRDCVITMEQEKITVMMIQLFIWCAIMTVLKCMYMYVCMYVCMYTLNGCTSHLCIGYIAHKAVAQK